MIIGRRKFIYIGRLIAILLLLYTAFLYQNCSSSNSRTIASVSEDNSKIPTDNTSLDESSHQIPQNPPQQEGGNSNVTAHNNCVHYITYALTLTGSQTRSLFSSEITVFYNMVGGGGGAGSTSGTPGSTLAGSFTLVPGNPIELYVGGGGGSGYYGGIGQYLSGGGGGSGYFGGGGGGVGDADFATRGGNGGGGGSSAIVYNGSAVAVANGGAGGGVYGGAGGSSSGGRASSGGTDGSSLAGGNGAYIWGGGGLGGQGEFGGGVGGGGMSGGGGGFGSAGGNRGLPGGSTGGDSYFGFGAITLSNALPVGSSTLPPLSGHGGDYSEWPGNGGLIILAYSAPICGL